MFTKIRQFILAILLGGMMAGAWGQAVTVVEYYNTTLDAYFISGRNNEQVQLDGVADFHRTGMTFQAIAASFAGPELTRICRFYVSSNSPFTNSHFYGRQGTDCEYLRAQGLSEFNWEDYDFALAQPVSGACAANTVPIYRSFRPSANGKTSNHRYSASADTYLDSIAAGYNGEQVAFCATAATDVTPLPPPDCGTYYYGGLRISYESLNSDNVANRWTRAMAGSKVSFNGKLAQPVIENYVSGTVVSLMIDDAADSWADLGFSTQNTSGTVQVFYTPPTVLPRKMTVGQKIGINRYASYSPVQSFGSPLQTGDVTFVGMENVTVPAGSYTACKFSGQVTSQYDAIGRTDVKRTTTWIAPGVGMIKSEIQDTTTSGFGPVFPVTSTEVIATSVQPL